MVEGIRTVPHLHLRLCETKGHPRVKNTTKSLYTQIPRTSFTQQVEVNMSPEPSALCRQVKKLKFFLISKVAHHGKRREDKYHGSPGSQTPSSEWLSLPSVLSPLSHGLPSLKQLENLVTVHGHLRSYRLSMAHKVPSKSSPSISDPKDKDCCF